MKEKCWTCLPLQLKRISAVLALPSSPLSPTRIGFELLAAVRPLDSRHFGTLGPIKGGRVEVTECRSMISKEFEISFWVLTKKRGVLIKGRLKRGRHHANSESVPPKKHNLVPPNLANPASTTSMPFRVFNSSSSVTRNRSTMDGCGGSCRVGTDRD